MYRAFVSTLRKRLRSGFGQGSRRPDELGLQMFSNSQYSLGGLSGRAGILMRLCGRCLYKTHACWGGAI